MGPPRALQTSTTRYEGFSSPALLDPALLGCSSGLSHGWRATSGISSTPLRPHPQLLCSWLLSPSSQLLGFLKTPALGWPREPPLRLCAPGSSLLGEGAGTQPPLLTARPGDPCAPHTPRARGGNSLSFVGTPSFLPLTGFLFLSLLSLILSLSLSLLPLGLFLFLSTPLPTPPLTLLASFLRLSHLPGGGM